MISYQKRKKGKKKKDDINDFWANLVSVNCIFADE